MNKINILKEILLEELKELKCEKELNLREWDNYKPIDKGESDEYYKRNNDLIDGKILGIQKALYYIGWDGKYE